MLPGDGCRVLQQCWRCNYRVGYFESTWSSASIVCLQQSGQNIKIWQPYLPPNRIGFQWSSWRGRAHCRRLSQLRHHRMHVHIRYIPPTQPDSQHLIFSCSPPPHFTAIPASSARTSIAIPSCAPATAAAAAVALAAWTTCFDFIEG